MHEGEKLTTEDILDAVMPKAERDDKTMDQTDSYVTSVAWTAFFFTWNNNPVHVNYKIIGISAELKKEFNAE